MICVWCDLFHWISFKFKRKKGNRFQKMESINSKLFKCKKHIDSLSTLAFNIQHISNVTNWFQVS